VTALCLTHVSPCLLSFSVALESVVLCEAPRPRGSCHASVGLGGRASVPRP
jgi:hypothetical protein